MSEKEIIESGKLELYVSGALCGKERQLVIDALRDSAALRAVVAEIEDSFLAALNESNIAPSDAVRQRVLAAIEPVGAPIERNIKSAISTVDIPKTFNINPWLAAASIAMLVGMVALFFTTNQTIENQKNQLAALKTQNENTIANNQIALLDYESKLALINDLSTKRVLLKGVESSPNSSSIVYWNTKNGTVLINPNSLPTPPSDKQYQLWALLDEKPIDAGVFDLEKNKSVLQQLKNIENAQAFAITLENKGGVASPTLTAMYVLGTV